MIFTVNGRLRQTGLPGPVLLFGWYITAYIHVHVVIGTENQLFTLHPFFSKRLLDF